MKIAVPINVRIVIGFFDASKAPIAVPADSTHDSQKTVKGVHASIFTPCRGISYANHIPADPAKRKGDGELPRRRLVARFPETPSGDFNAAARSRASVAYNWRDDRGDYR